MECFCIFKLFFMQNLKQVCFVWLWILHKFWTSIWTTVQWVISMRPLKITGKFRSISENWDPNYLTLGFPWDFFLGKKVRCTFILMLPWRLKQPLGRPMLRKCISVKFILPSGIVVCFIIQLLSKLRIKETNFLWKIFLNWVHFLLQTCVIDSFLLWRISIEEN